MASIETAIRNYTSLVSGAGRAALNVKFPNEFELYVLALELMDGKGKTLRYFLWPIMPSSIDELQNNVTNIRKTQAGVSTLSNTTFTPGDITINGNFGRKFKVLLGANYQSLTSALTTISSSNSLLSAVKSVANGVSAVFDPRVKTGYGCLKILEEIIDESRIVDKNGPRRLVLYNPVFGNNYVVKPISFKINATQDMNMFHNYTLQLKTIAPLDSLQTDKDNTNLALQLNTSSYLQKRANIAISQLSTLLAK